MMDPTALGPVTPGTESWGQQYGPIGVIAALAIAILILWVRQLFIQQREDKQRQNQESDEQAKRITALSDRLVETVTSSHRETLELIANVTRENEQRYQALLDRHIAETRSNAEALRAQSTATTEALSGLVKKLSKTAD